jgi:hypothetical protein
MAFILKKLNEVEGKEQHCVEISNRFAALENLHAEVDIYILPSAIKKNLIHSVWNKEDVLDEWEESIIVPVYKKGNETD